MSAKSAKMGLNATWSMAVGGMVGGGIFSVLGLIVSLAGEWAWASFVVAGLIALATGHSYVSLAAATLAVRLAANDPVALGALVLLSLIAVVGRPLLRTTK